MTQEITFRCPPGPREPLRGRRSRLPVIRLQRPELLLRSGPISRDSNLSKLQVNFLRFFSLSFLFSHACRHDVLRFAVSLSLSIPPGPFSRMRLWRRLQTRCPCSSVSSTPQSSSSIRRPSSSSWRTSQGFRTFSSRRRHLSAT